MRKQSGISLIEQLVTLVITSFAVLGVAKFQATMFDAELNSKQRAEAVSLAQQKLEVLRSTGYVAQAVSGQDETKGMTTKFSRSWTITPDTASLYDKVSVTVTWSVKGSSSNVNLNSRVAKVSKTNSALFMLGQVGVGPGPLADVSPNPVGEAPQETRLARNAPRPDANEESVLTDVKTKGSDKVHPTKS
jgi:Tfp pilus assembly protein PilV